MFGRAKLSQITDFCGKPRRPVKEGVQRCDCGAARSATIDRAGEPTSAEPWTLSGYLVDYLVAMTELDGPMTEQELADERQNLQDGDDGDLELLTGRWAAPMTFSDVRALCETAHKMTKEEASRRDETEGDCLVQVPADWNSR